METVILSIGGSLINPGEIDVAFLRRLRDFVLSSSCRFVLVCGGGSPARVYQSALRNFTGDEVSLDWLGIEATSLNGHLVRHILSDVALPDVFREPKKVAFKKVLVACGWKPGCSTDFDAVLWAKFLGSDRVINLTNVDFVYDKDPKKHKDAKRLESLSWSDYLGMIGDWSAGKHAPFDPVASKEAKKSKIKAFIVGPSLDNVSNIISGKSFIGSVIE